MPELSEKETVKKVTEAELCPHFGDCGGCESQDVPYDLQLARKSESLQSLFEGRWTQEIPIQPSPAIWHYRNKVDFSFNLKRYDEPPPKDFQRETVLGYNRKGKWYWPLDIDECRIAPEGTNDLLREVRDWYRLQNLNAYDSRRKEGLLRALLVREGRRTGQKMVMLVTSAGAFDTEPFVASVERAWRGCSIYRGIYSGAAQGAFADEIEHLSGPETIEERLEIPTDEGLRMLRFRVSPFSFFQTNTLGAEVLYGDVRRWVQSTGAETLYDLYGGGGGIAFSCADLVKTVRSVESEASATKDAEHNASMNGIRNVFFTTQKMKNYLLDMVNTGGMEPNSAAVVDPPRAGMHPKALKRLIASQPPDILYVSCKPSVFVEELRLLSDSYDLVDLRAVDLFPHTPHVELLASLRLR